jgi:OFA family oxalate/formate antiporter-like MFS transporter
VPLANILEAATGNWRGVFLATALMNFVVVIMALLVLKPLRTRRMRLAQQQPVPAE